MGPRGTQSDTTRKPNDDTSSAAIGIAYTFSVTIQLNMWMILEEASKGKLEDMSFWELCRRRNFLMLSKDHLGSEWKAVLEKIEGLLKVKKHRFFCEMVCVCEN